MASPMRAIITIRPKNLGELPKGSRGLFSKPQGGRLSKYTPFPKAFWGELVNLRRVRPKVAAGAWNQLPNQLSPFLLPKWHAERPGLSFWQHDPAAPYFFQAPRFPKRF